MSAGDLKAGVLAAFLLAAIVTLIACSAILLGMSAWLAIVLSTITTALLGWVGVQRFTPQGQYWRDLRRAKRAAIVGDDASDLLRLLLEHGKYAETTKFLETNLPADCVARKSLIALVAQISATNRSIDLVSGRTGVDLGQEQLLDNTTEFIVVKTGQAGLVHRHNYQGPATESSLNRIAKQSSDLSQILEACRVELVEASGRDSFDDMRLDYSRRDIQSVADLAKSLNRDPFGDLYTEEI